MERNLCIIAGRISKCRVRDGSQMDLFQEAAKAWRPDNASGRNELDGKVPTNTMVASSGVVR